MQQDSVVKALDVHVSVNFSSSPAGTHINHWWRQEGLAASIAAVRAPVKSCVTDGYIRAYMTRQCTMLKCLSFTLLLCYSVHESLWNGPRRMYI